MCERGSYTTEYKNSASGRSSIQKCTRDSRAKSIRPLKLSLDSALYHKVTEWAHSSSLDIILDFVYHNFSISVALCSEIDFEV